MKISLKRVILCGSCFLATLFFLLVLIVPIKAFYGVELSKDVWSLSVQDSWLHGGANATFHPAFLNAFTKQVFYSTSETKQIPETLASTADGTLKTMSIIGLIIVIFDFLAVIGAFFLKTQKGARKLIIPFMAVSVVMMFLVIVIPGSLLCMTQTFEGGFVRFGDAQLGTLEILYFIGVGLFVAALVVAGVVKDKVLYEKKK